MAVSDPLEFAKPAGVVIEVHADKEVQGLVQSLENISAGTALHKYWSDQATMIDRVKKSYDDLRKAMSGQGDVSIVGPEFIKSINALKALSKDGSLPVDAFGKQFSKMSELFDKMVQRYPQVAQSYSVDAFRPLFEGFRLAENQASKLYTQIEAIYNMRGSENAADRIKKLEKALSDAKREAAELQVIVDDSLDVERMRDLADQRQSLIDKNVEEFKALAVAAKLPAFNEYSEDYDDWRVQKAFERVREGALSATEAIGYLKQTYSSLFTEHSIGDSSVDQFQSLSTNIEQVKTGLSDVHSMLTTLTQDGVKVKPGTGVPGVDTTDIHNTVGELQQLITASDAAKQPTNEVAQSVTKLVEALAQLTSPEHGESAATIQSILYRLTNLRDLKIPQGPLNALIRFASSLRDVGSVDNVRAISGLDFSGFKALENMQTRGGPLYTMAKYLPMISQVPVAPLEALSRVDFANIASGLAQFSGKDIKFRFDTAMGDESGALADSTKRFADHTEQVYKAVEAEKAKEEQAVKLTEALGREAVAFKNAGMSVQVGSGNLVAGMFQPGTLTNTNLDALETGLRRLGTSESDILNITASMEAFDASIASVKTNVDQTSGELLSMEVVARNAANTAQTVWRGVFDNQNKTWSWTDSTSYNFARENAQSAKAEASSAKLAYDNLISAYKTYYDLQSKLAANPNSSGSAMWQQQLAGLQQQLPILEAEANKYRDIADKAGILNKYTEQRTALENNYLNVLAQAVDKLDAADKKTQQAALTTSYTALTAQMQRMYDLQTRIANNPNSPNVETWQAEADVLRSQIEHNEQVLHQYDDMAQELGLLNKYQTKRNQLEQDYMALVRDLWQKRADKAATQAEKDQAQAQANAIKTWQAALQAVSETTPSLRLHLIDRSSLDDLDDLRDKLRDAFGDLRNISETAVKNGAVEFSDEQIKALSALNTLLEQYINKRNELQRQSRQDSAVGSDASAVAKVRAKVAAEYERYRSAIDKSADSLARFRAIESRAAKLQNGDTEGIKKVITDLNTLIADLIKGGATVDSFMQKLSKGFAGKLFYGVLARASMYVRQFARQIVTNVKEVNTALTQLQIVTRGTGNDMVAYFNRAAESAQRLGVSMKDLIDSTTTFARLGYSAEESSLLADYVAMLTKVGAIDTSDATDAVTAMVKAFDIELEDLQSVMDKMVIVGNNFPISVSQIAEGMNNASSALAAAGNSVEESMALLTAANTTVQNISKSSTGLRTIAARLRKTVVSDDGEEEAMSESDYNDLVRALTKQKVALTDINGEYRSTYDIIQDIAAVWDSMSSMDQAALAEKLAGTRQQNIFYSLVGQFKEAQGAVEATTKVGGEMAAAYDVYLDSVEGKLGKLNATFQVFSNDFLSSDTFNAVLNLGNGLLGVADALAKVNTLLPLFATGVMARKAYTSIAETEGFRDVLKGLVEQNTELGKQSGRLTKLKAAWQSAGIGMKAALGVGAAVTVISTVIGLIQQAQEKQKAAAQEAYQSYSEQAQSIDDYKTKIAELREQLDEGNLSEEQAYEVRKELIGIQDEVTQKLGKEAAAFDVLHDSIESVNNVMDAFSQSNADNAYRKNQKTFDKAIDIIENRNKASYVVPGLDEEVPDAVTEILNNIFGDQLQTVFAELNGTSTSFTAIVPRDLREYLEQVGEYARAIEQLGDQAPDGLLDRINSYIDKLYEEWHDGAGFAGIFDLFDSYDEVLQYYDEAVGLRVARNLDYVEIRHDLNQYKKEFENAIANEDWSAASEAFQSMMSVNLDKVDDESVKRYFQAVQRQFETESSHYMVDINLRTRIVSSGALPALQSAVAPFSGDEVALRSAGQDSSELSDEQRAAYLQLNEAAEANGVTFDHLIDILIDLGVVTKRATAETKDLAEALTITQLDTTRGVVKSFHDAWTSMTNDGEVAFDKLKGIFSSLTDKDGKALVDGLDGYISRLAELRNDVPATEAVLNELFAAYVEGQINGDSLAESDLHIVEAMLKEAGVANETEVALDLLVTAKLKAADANGTLIDASGNLDATLIAEIQALIGDGDAAVYAATKLAELELQKIILSNNPLNMTSSISTLSALAGQSTTTAAALAGLFAAVEKVQSISTRIESLEAQLSPDITNDYFSEAERIGRVMDELAALRGQQTSFSNLIMTEAKRAMEELSSTLPSTGIQWTPPTASGSGSGGSTKTFADTLKERYEADNKSLEAQLDLLKHQYDEYRRIGDDDRANQNIRDQAAIYDIIMANAHDAAEELRNYYLSLGLTLDEINKQADVLEYSNIWWDAYENKLALVQQQLDDLKQSLDDVTGELDSFQNIYKTLISAAEQYHTDGFLHVDTLKEILSFGPEYLQFLSDENGQLSYNEEALQKVIAAKTEEMAIDTALMYLRRVMSAVESNNANELKKLADITNLTAQNTWALVDAQLALVKDKVSEQYYNNISTNINRLKSLTVSATSAISQYVDSLHSSYMSQKDGMEQLFDIVKEYVKWENEHHIELLEEEKKKYGELVDKKKEMLDLSKSEDDHNKSVAKKLKEIADLETRIALLELDDSREAQAEKAKLQKELAEKNDDLTDSQQSYYIDKQKEALDKDKENFEKKKDSEIDILKKELNTEEKLYQATLKRIQTEWTNGWGNFYNTLKQWNVEYGSHLSSTLAGALDKASEAIGKWGDPITALQQVGNDELIGDTRGQMRANALRWWTTFGAERDSLPGENQRLADIFNEMTGLGLTPRNGAWYLGDGSRFFELSKDEIAAAIIAAMQANSAGWFTASKEEQQVLAQNNVDLAARLGEVLDEILTRKDGVWYRADGTRLYSEGGVADYTGMAILHGGKAAELVLNNADVSKVYDLIHNTPSLVGSFFSKMLGNANSAFRNGNYGTGGGDINMDFNVTINHTGSMSDADARRYGDTIASAALDKLRDTFSKRGVRSVGPATLKA